ncbi:MAG TPA: intein-containing Rv2578c family radical SAM protein [Actinophytocola sp.]|uniref:intein-containing Rv2578c family radical SAM protein n=1 Tax=Actinophytocola sp. TaxID=1872138 RepID=UPI002DC01FE4|nr:intein-containing Rv2578c family radical SAM protein [Actinophytocola sp.]HEU5472846.1 intein-containing Rv2578c family radical SAM protein [Actinophytocola sp.]
MRWDSQLTGVDEQVLPGLPGLVRSVRTPEFAGMVFHEVRAKSVLNKVPASSMPFNWSVNPYRGCSHGCRYCLAGDTPILLADGRTRPLAELRPGDRIYGTERRGNYRRYVPTVVLDHWSTVKPAYRVSLADGTTLIASGDHRFLTERGWKHVTGAMRGPDRRPHLTTGNKLVGTGAFAAPPKQLTEYRLGYLCGLIRGGGRAPAALARARTYLAELDVASDRLLEVPRPAGAEWSKGLLAGVFDARGTGARGIARIATGTAELTRLTETALRGLGFACVVEKSRWTEELPWVRLLGGLPGRLRFFHTVDPAVLEHRNLDGTAVKSGARLDVVAVEPLGLELPLFDITTGTGDFIANGVISHNCYARHSHTYLDLDSGTDFDNQIVVKVNAPEVLAAQLRSPRWTREHVAMGTNTDPYQRAEGRYALMPGIIRALADSGTPFSILTKGTVLSRDLPLLAAAAADVSVGIGVSIALVDRDLQRSLEPGTASPQARLELVRRVREAGLPCGVFVAPVLPRLTDSIEALDALFSAIAEAGATGVTVLPLHLRPGAREWFAGWLGREHPDLVPSYREIYGHRRTAGRDYRRWLAARVQPLLRRHGLGPPAPTRDSTHEAGPDAEGWPAGSLPAGAPTDVPVQQEQLALL